MTALRDEAMVREMLREAFDAGVDWQPARNSTDTIDRILASHPAPTPAPKAGPQAELEELEALSRMAAPSITTLHAGAVERVMRAFDETEAVVVDRREHFAAVVAEALALPAPAPSELLEHAVRMSVEAWEQSYALFGDHDERAQARDHFLAAARDRLAQTFVAVNAELALARQASELMSAAEYLDASEYQAKFSSILEEHVEWSSGVSKGTAPTLHLAILAAARSLGWGGK